MPHKPDLDTETGLPRKLGWKVAFWALAALQVVAIAYLGQIQGRLDGMSAKQTEALERIARIEGKLEGVPAKAVAAVIAAPKPIP